MEKKVMAVRMYSINQERVDEAVQAYLDLILDIASDKKLADIQDQIGKRLATPKEG